MPIMKFHLFKILLIFLPLLVTSQDISKVTSLNDDIAETSGLIFFENILITHNDSGGMNALYEINKSNGNIQRTVTINTATNIDWEDICQDDEYIYIGDFGNNNGNRTNLKIYKVLKSDYLNSTSISAEVIEFNYADQNDFISSPNNTNFDAEALIAYEGDLYIFTKNWIDRRTNIYKVPKNPGKYSVDKIDEFDSQGLITGGTFNPLGKKIVLTGYAGIKAFAIELSGFYDGKFSNGLTEKYNLDLPFTASFQIEAIDYFGAKNYYVSAEKNALGDATLYTLVSTTLSLDDLDLIQKVVYPNPASETLKVNSSLELEKIEIFNYLGQKIYEDTSGLKDINISAFSKGVYILKIYAGNRMSSIKFLKE